MKQWHGGKGSIRRKETGTQYQENWDKIFGNEKSCGGTPSGWIPEEKFKRDRTDFIEEEEE